VGLNSDYLCDSWCHWSVFQGILRTGPDEPSARCVQHTGLWGGGPKGAEMANALFEAFPFRDVFLGRPKSPLRRSKVVKMESISSNGCPRGAFWETFCHFLGDCGVLLDATHSQAKTYIFRFGRS